MAATNDFTIGILLYGEYTNLGHRCINSIAEECREVFPRDVRVGLNQVCNRTSIYVDALVEQGWLLPKNVYRSAENIHKYPMMRRMFYDPDNPIETKYVMWFDDDSFVRAKQDASDASFLARVKERLEGGDNPTGMVGSVYTIGVNVNQRHWIEDQPWFTGQPVGDKISFATGGWWAARTAVLQQHNYPWPELDHRGGDVMLGALMAQQGLSIRQFRDGVAINADQNGNESKSPRRGFDQQPIGTDYERTTVEPEQPKLETKKRRPRIKLDL